MLQHRHPLDAESPRVAVPPRGIDATVAQHLRVDHPASADLKPTLRSEEHTSELQSRSDLVCRLLLEKKKILSSRVDPHSNILNLIPIRLPSSRNMSPPSI